MSNDPLHSAKYVLEHAKRRRVEFERESVVYLESKPFAKVVEEDPSSGMRIHKVKLTKPLPLELPGIVFDSLNNLRSCLDHIGFAAAKACNSTHGRYAKFPFGDTPENAQSFKGSASKHIPEPIFERMMSYRPYESGDRTLWSINKLCNTKKHQVIIPFCMNGPTTFTGHITTGGWHSGQGRWDTVKQEIVISRVEPGAQVKLKVHLDAYVAFSDVIDLEGTPVADVLRAMESTVRRILTEIEADAWNLGIFK